MNHLRITSGKLKGQKVATPGGNTHPMGERERLALFNMIFEYIPGADVLDAFAGSGALGIEALSRGAQKVVFVEKNTEACRIIRKNISELNLNADVVKSEILKFTSKSTFDIILADPPYDNFEENGVRYLTRFLKKGGIFVLSHPNEAPEIPNMELEKTRKYASARISIFRKR